MAVKIKSKAESIAIQEAPVNRLKIPAITGAPVKTPNIIIRAIKIMLMDIRMLLHSKQTSEELEAYTQFAELARGKR